jgi:DNA-binding Lrp family transcriptional regulator
MSSLDNIDIGILALLGRNSRSNGPNISKELSEMQISLTDRAVLQRLERLEQKKIIQGYTITLNPSILAQKHTRLIFLKFMPSIERIEIEKLDSYLIEAPFCLYAARLQGANFDYICQFVFDTQKQFDLMLNVILRGFRNIISEYMLCGSEIVKQVLYRVAFDTSLERKKNALMISLALNENGNIREKLRQFTDDVYSCFEAKCVCLWLIDKKTDELTLTNAYGNYENIPTEYAEISWSSINLESILQTKKPVLVNDLVNEFKGIIVDWLIKENVRSYAGYPLEGKDRVVGVLEIFNDKPFCPVDFELLQSLSLQVSSELSKSY